MKQLRDRKLTEAMGECWHRHDCCPDKDEYGITYHCEKCGVDFSFSYNDENKGMPYNDFSSCIGFFKLWGWATTQEWWHSFLTSLTIKSFPNAPVFSGMVGMAQYVNPDKFANAVYDYLQKAK